MLGGSIVCAVEPTQSYWVYLVRCEDGSYYTGITTDVERRFQEHKERGPKAAHYTRTHHVVALEATWRVAGRSAASKLEYRVKQLTHQQKAQLAENPAALFALVPDAPRGAVPAS
jgi:putative endonuclease